MYVLKQDKETANTYPLMEWIIKFLKTFAQIISLAYCGMRKRFLIFFFMDFCLLMYVYQPMLKVYLDGKHIKDFSWFSLSKLKHWKLIEINIFLLVESLRFQLVAITRNYEINILSKRNLQKSIRWNGLSVFSAWFIACM